MLERMKEIEITKQLLLNKIIFIFAELFVVFILWNIKFTPEYLLYNLAFIWFISGTCFLLFKNNIVAYILETLVLVSIYFIDMEIFMIRDSHIQYRDFYAWKTALQIAKDSYYIQWNIIMQKKFLLVFIISILSICIMHFINKRNNKKGWGNISLNIVIMITGGLLIGILMLGKNSTNERYEYTGFTTQINSEVPGGLLLYWWNQMIEEYKMARYDKVRAKEVKENFDNEKEEGRNFPKNIVVIMNESLTDYEQIGTPIYNKDPLERIHNMKNSIEGKMLMSVYGGGTCNSEFEFLTGMSMQFLQDSYPYTMYIHQDIQALPRDFIEHDFHTIGIHPYYRIGWNRQSVYPFLGFQERIFGEDFAKSNHFLKEADINDLKDRNSFGKGLEYYRGFIRDREGYRKILEKIDNNEENQFIFFVTIHNHGGYGAKGIESNTIKYVNSNAINDYLNSIHTSDEDFYSFTKELQKRNEKTMVLMFGDHQPAIDPEEFVDIFEQYDLPTSQNQPLYKYMVPYIFWSNYPISWKKLPEVISPDFLGILLKKQINIPLTGWDKLRVEVKEKYPVVNGVIVLDQQGNVIEDSQIAEDRLLQDYKNWQLLELFH